jgi:hypothetical protein
MVVITNLIPEHDNPDVLSRIRDINKDTYNKTVVLGTLIREVR